MSSRAALRIIASSIPSAHGILMSTRSSVGTCMMMLPRRTVYSPAVVDHYKNPRNVGKMDKTDENVGFATKGAGECGDMLSIYMKVNEETQVIEDVKFKAFGCGSAIAASSFASELIRGQTLAQALELTNKDIATELSLPPVKLHCSMLAEEAIHAAANNYLSKKPMRKVKKTRNSEGGEAANTTSEGAEKTAAA
jgi:Fe-S cluster assembly scaffold IscU